MQPIQDPEGSDLSQRREFPGERSSLVIELILFALVVAVLNVPLLSSGVMESMIFLPDSVAAGQWWRVLAHPFVHLSWYHLLLDAGAFLLLYGGLQEPTRFRRLLVVVASAGGSLGLSLLVSPVIQTQGLCGLSGVAHGLMAFSGLESLSSPTADRSSRITGLLSFGIVSIKSLLEVLQGHVFFEFLHFGLMGVPVPACHAGGVLFGTGAFIALKTVLSDVTASPGHRSESRLPCAR
jgi:rhomboid family GlyGly-CTERM serine protease